MRTLDNYKQFITTNKSNKVLGIFEIFDQQRKMLEVIINKLDDDNRLYNFIDDLITYVNMQYRNGFNPDLMTCGLLYNMYAECTKDDGSDRSKVVEYIELKHQRQVNAEHLMMRKLQCSLLSRIKDTTTKAKEDLVFTRMENSYKKSVSLRKNPESNDHLIKHTRTESEVSELMAEKSYSGHVKRRDKVREAYSKGVEASKISKDYHVMESTVKIARNLEANGMNVRFLAESKKLRTSYSIYLPDQHTVIDIIGPEDRKRLSRIYKRKYLPIMRALDGNNLLVIESTNLNLNTITEELLNLIPTIKSKRPKVRFEGEMHEIGAVGFALQGEVEVLERLLGETRINYNNLLEPLCRVPIQQGW